MPAPVTVALLALFCIGVLLAMRAGWRARARRTGALVPELPAVPAADDPALGAPRTEPFDATYVSSTSAGDWLDRIVVHDLGVRSGAGVRVFDAGVRIERAGARSVFVPAAALRGVRAEAGIAGKFVGREGLVVITWQAQGEGATLVDTGLRLRHSADRTVLIDAVRAITPDPSDADRPTPDQPADDPGTATKEHT